MIIKTKAEFENEIGQLLKALFPEPETNEPEPKVKARKKAALGLSEPQVHKIMSRMNDFLVQAQDRGDIGRRKAAAFFQQCSIRDAAFCEELQALDLKQTGAGPIVRLERFLAGVFQMINRRLPMALRRREFADFKITWSEVDGKLKGIGHWISAPPGNIMSLREAAEQAAKSHAELNVPLAKQAADLLLRVLRDGDDILPGLEVTRESDSHSAVFRRRPPVIQSRANSVSSPLAVQLPDEVEQALFNNRPVLAVMLEVVGAYARHHDDDHLRESLDTVIREIMKTLEIDRSDVVAALKQVGMLQLKNYENQTGAKEQGLDVSILEDDVIIKMLGLLKDEKPEVLMPEYLSGKTGTHQKKTARHAN